MGRKPKSRTLFQGANVGNGEQERTGVRWPASVSAMDGAGRAEKQLQQGGGGGGGGVGWGGGLPESVTMKNLIRQSNFMGK